MRNIIEDDLAVTRAFTDAYKQALTKAEEYKRDVVTRRMLRDMLWGARAQGVNEIVHGVSVADSKGSKEPT